MAFIIDSYNQWDKWDQENSVYVFKVNGQWYAVKEVILFWGLPQLPERLEENRNPETYKIYDRLEDAMAFVFMIKGLNPA